MKKEKVDLNAFTLLVDTREQTPYSFPNMEVVGLKFGDYSISYQGKSYENEIVFERKSCISELFAFSGSERDRFCRELEKMQGVKYKYILIEHTMLDIVNKQPPGVLPATTVYSTLCSYAIKYQIPFLFCDNRVNARNMMLKMCQFYFKYHVLKIGLDKSDRL